jgi:hypothetical protein
MGRKKCILGLVEKPTAKRPLRRPRCRQKENIKKGVIKQV